MCLFSLQNCLTINTVDLLSTEFLKPFISPKVRVVTDQTLREPGRNDMVIYGLLFKVNFLTGCTAGSHSPEVHSRVVQLLGN